MEKKKVSTTSRPLGMCEKLFNAFNPAFRPLRRLTFRHQEPGGTTNPSSTRPNYSLDSGTKDPGPQKALPTSAKLIPPTSEKKPAETVAPKAEPHHPLPTPAAPPPPPPPPPPPTTSVPVRRVPDKVVPPSAAPPKAVTIPQPMPPKAVATPQPLPQPAPPAGAAAATERSKKNINERVEDYIKRRKHKMRVGSGVGRDGSGK